MRRVATIVALLTILSAGAAAQQTLPKEKQTKQAQYLSPKEAYAVVTAEQAKILFVDIRTRGELQFVGVPTDVDGYIPFVEMNEFGEWDDKAGRYKLEPNSTFTSSVEQLLARKGLNKTDKIILSCRSGDRSARAANQLTDAGFTNVWHQVEGFEGDLSPDGRRSVNGWKNAGLPWTYKLEKAKVYLPNR